MSASATRTVVGGDSGSVVDDPETHHAPATDFETMADRIRRGHYTSTADGYASSGFRVFDANKFARDLGFDKSTLTDDIGLIEDAGRPGLSGLRQPTVEELAGRWDELREHRSEELIEWAKSQEKDIEIVRRECPDAS